MENQNPQQTPTITVLKQLIADLALDGVHARLQPEDGKLVIANPAGYYVLEISKITHTPAEGLEIEQK